MRYVRGWCAVAATVLCLTSACNGSLTGGASEEPDLGVGEPDFGTPAVFDVQPSGLQTITVNVGQTSPAVVFAATLDGQPGDASWSLDRGDVGSIQLGPAPTGTFVPRGTTGGLVTIRATASGQTLTRQILVKLTGTQNGANTSIPGQKAQVPSTVDQLTSSGGVGGVGGEGLGVAVTDPGTLSALMTPQSSGQVQNLTLLYPYDGTVWPRGMLAPLLQWRWTTNDADAVRIDLSTTSGSFTWSGTFGRPAILATTGGPFIRHPIPQDVWERATNSAGGVTPSGQPDRLSIKVTIAKGGMGYGPMTQTWTIAPARLSGIIYYQSYGTLLAQNYDGALGGNGRFGGAVLSIRVGDTGPKLTAGANGTSAQCRICHSVAADGSRLVVQHGDLDTVSSAYTLTQTGATEQVMSTGAQYPAIYPDGSMALTPAGQILPLPAGGPAVQPAGLSTVATNLGTPAFSPSGSLVAFNPMAGSLANPTQKLLVMNFDSMTRTFSNPVVVVDDTGKPAETRPGWPAVFPDGNAVVFHHQIAAGADGNGLGNLPTRKGAQAQIAWTGITGAGSVTTLNQLNGLKADGSSYLPKLPAPTTLACTGDGVSVGGIGADHGIDATLNYEPTVNPVASGGYAWVVFTSRRLYGNQATIPPFCSDPRGVDLVKNITTKKLWVAAIDVTGKPGTDASHPAFYLPAQELLAGNTRGFWVLDPCKSNGSSCESGDQCCGGYCTPSGTDGSLSCSEKPADQCAKVQEKCGTVADCCDPHNLCVNNFCTVRPIG